MRRLERRCPRCGNKWTDHWRFEGVIAPPTVTDGPATPSAVLAAACWVRPEGQMTHPEASK